MIAAAVIAGVVIAFFAVRRYIRWRDRQSMIASPQDLWAHTMAYEPKARERRQ